MVAAAAGATGAFVGAAAAAVAPDEAEVVAAGPLGAEGGASCFVDGAAGAEVDDGALGASAADLAVAA